jgi:YedE family putative selenium metabolism protein
LKNQQYLMIGAGLVFGSLAAYMTKLGNPGNMGICVACFYRDITGALGLHRAEVVQYLRPEIMGLCLGAFVAALSFGEFRARGGSNPLVRFILGMFVMIGALVFLGCPVRAVLRLAGGDLNALYAIAGIIVGALIGIYFLKRGFNLGRTNSTYSIAGYLMPLIMAGLLIFAMVQPQFLFNSESGPGSMHASLAIALVVGLIIGFLAQKTRMCFVGGWRDLPARAEFLLELYLQLLALDLFPFPDFQSSFNGPIQHQGAEGMAKLTRASNLVQPLA